MAARLPINDLPFETDDSLHTFEVIDPETGNLVERQLTKRQYFDIALGDWYAKSNAFAAAKEAEAEARTKVIQLIYPDSYDEEGTEKYQLPAGWVLEMEKRINVKVEQAVLAGLIEQIEKLPVDENGEMPTIDAAIKMKPDFSMSGWRDLRPDVKVILQDALTFTPGTAGVKLKPPSAKATARVSDQKAQAKKS